MQHRSFYSGPSSRSLQATQLGREPTGRGAATPAAPYRSRTMGHVTGAAPRSRLTTPEPPGTAFLAAPRSQGQLGYAAVASGLHSPALPQMGAAQASAMGLSRTSSARRTVSQSESCLLAALEAERVRPVAAARISAGGAPGCGLPRLQSAGSFRERLPAGGASAGSAAGRNQLAPLGTDQTTVPSRGASAATTYVAGGNAEQLQPSSSRRMLGPLSRPVSSGA